MNENYVYKKYDISLSNMLILGVVFSFLITWSYGNSYPVYVTTSLMASVFAFGFFFRKILYQSHTSEVLVLLILIVSLMMSLINGGVLSCIQVNASLVMIFAVSYLVIDYNNISGQFVKIAVVVVIIAMLSGRMILNSNSRGFLMYICGSLGFIWFVFEENKIKKLFSIVYMAYMFLLLFETGSRNAGIVIVICSILVIIPKPWYRKPIFYRTLYIVAMTLTIFAADFFRYLFQTPKLMNSISQFTQLFSDKIWGMDGHLDVLIHVQERVAELGFLSKLFGEGVKLHHCHNLFYQCVFFYGYVGTAFLYGILVFIIEKGFKIYRYYDNKLSLGCCIVMLGHILMQIGEVYMFGSETMLLGALLPMSIILNQSTRQPSID